MSTISMAYSSTTINIATPDHPEQWKEDLQQVRSRAMGGRVVSVTRTASALKNPVLHWSSMTEANYNTLKTFINTTISGTTNSFTFTDWDSTGHTAYYMGGLEKARSTTFNTWVVDIQLAII